MAKQWQPLRWLRTRHPVAADAMADLWSSIRPWLPPVNFITVHHAYFILAGLLFAVLFWGISRPSESVSFMDSLFLVESAFTGSGLNTINLSALNVAQQVIMAIMMILGSPIVVALFTIWFRAHIFEQRFEDIVQSERNRSLQQTGTIVGMAGAMFAIPIMSSFKRGQQAKTPRPTSASLSPPSAPIRRGTWQHAQRAAADAFKLSPRPKQDTPPLPAPSPLLQTIQQSHVLQVDDSGASPRPQSAFRRAPTAFRSNGMSSEDLRPVTTDGAGGFDLKTFISANKKSIGRNAQFHDLTDEQREFLGGVEWRALRILFVIVSVYFVVFQVLGAIALGAWMSVHAVSLSAVNDQNPWWAGIFLAISAFNNAGLTLLDAGIGAFNNDAFVLTAVALLALMGNYAFPAFIRATVFMCYYVLKRSTEEHEHIHVKDALKFILKYPRRIFMLMFPSSANLMFIGICTVLAVLNWVGLLVLSIGNDVYEVFPLGQRIGVALFQALAIPSSGYLATSASSLYFDVQVLWVLMMYLAAYPEIITMRNSNVYEERSLGIYKTSNESAEELDKKAEESSSDQDTLPISTREPTLLSPRPMSAMSAAASYATTTQSIRRIAAVGRRGTAFMATQIKKRVNNFQGVGVAPPPNKTHVVTVPQLRFDGKAAAAPVVVAEEGHVDLVTQHLRSQLSHDIWAIGLALFVITLIETSHSLGDPQTYSVFNFLFEIVSGYTNIGLSIGLPDQAYSFSGGWYTGSKLVMVMVMVRGRHRGLPVALDHSVKLPGWDEAKRQQEDADIRRSINKSRRDLARTASY